MTDPKNDPHAELMRMIQALEISAARDGRDEHPTDRTQQAYECANAFARTLTNRIAELEAELARPETTAVSLMRAELHNSIDRTERAERMFGAACADLGAINEALGLDPDDGGAEPILDAIKELQANAPPLLTDDERRDEQARHEAVIERLIPPLLTDDERRDEQAAFSAIELAAHVYADAYTELQCDSDNDRQRDHRRALTEMRRVIRAEITRFSRTNRALICDPSCTEGGIYEQRLRAVLDVVQQYLPPDGLAIKDAMSVIISLVDPWPAACQKDAP